MEQKESSRLLISLAFVFGLTALTAVNFIIAGIPESVTALTLSYSRLLFGGAVLVIVGMGLGLRLTPTRKHLWRYVVCGLLNMGIPLALLTLALRNYDQTPLDAAIVEAGIPGLVLVYLLAGRRRLTWKAAVASLGVCAGLTYFLGVFELGASSANLNTGSWLLLASAIITATGLIVDEIINWPQEVPTRREWEWKVVTKATVTKSLRKTMFCAFISGAATLLMIPLLNPVLPNKEVVYVSMREWSGIAALGVAGTCIAWFSIFLLIQLRQLVLVAAMVASIPIATLAYASLTGYAKNPITYYQWVGALILIVSLSSLIYQQLWTRDNSIDPSLTNELATE